MATVNKTNRTIVKPHATSLSQKELNLVEAIVSQVVANRPTDITATWTQALDGIKRSVDAQKVDPDMRKALTLAVASLKGIPAPKLNTILQLWHTAVDFSLTQQRTKGK